MYQSGIGVKENDAEAFAWYRKAAEHGHPYAQNALGFQYLGTRTVEQNPAEALKWFLKADLAQNDVDASREAENNLAYIYLNGLGVRVDSQKAIDYYMRSAEKGHSGSMYSLGQLFEEGKVVPIIRISAKPKWYWLAVENGYGDARFRKDVVEFRLSPEQIDEATRTAKAWQSQHQPQDVPICQPLSQEMELGNAMLPAAPVHQ
jgi:TPR repeat protein